MRLFLLALLLAVPVCAQTAAPVPAPAQGAAKPVLEGDSKHPARGNRWVETRLYFGLGPADFPEEGISEAKWREFLDKEVTPRFPDGLSVLDVYGQWRGVKQNATERLHSKVVQIFYPRTLENEAKIEAIRAAWKQKTGDQSVLKVTEPVAVSF